MLARADRTSPNVKEWMVLGISAPPPVKSKMTKKVFNVKPGQLMLSAGLQGGRRGRFVKFILEEKFVQLQCSFRERKEKQLGIVSLCLSSIKVVDQTESPLPLRKLKQAD